MPKNVQQVEQISSVASTWVGLEAQIIVDSGLWTIRVHDGVTPGGFPLLVAGLNLSDITDKTAARGHLGLGTASTSAITDFDPAGAAAAITLFSLGAGSAATHAAADFDAAGSATAVLNTSAQKSQNLADLTNAGTARTNLGLGTAATQASTAFDAAGAAAAVSAALSPSITTAQNTANAAAVKANNLSDLTDAAAARTNLAIETTVLALAGAIDASDAAAGKRGQILTATGSGVDITTATSNVATLTLTPGRWLVFGHIDIVDASSPVGTTEFTGAIGATSATFPTAAECTHVLPYKDFAGVTMHFSCAPQPQYFSVSTNTNVYLLFARGAYGISGTRTASGRLRAVRL